MLSKERKGKREKGKGKREKGKRNKKNNLPWLLASAFCLISIISNAQCAMCRAALESEGNTAKAEGVNDGIVYLMVIPYILVAGVGYYVYRMNRKK
ncbi:MAG: hypothetical protein V4548_07245 [Bacteroidota bacterium]